jgi:GH25 family lysozyme M1 (1,4-beta-N-acetylmuramidase)
MAPGMGAIVFQDHVQPSLVEPSFQGSQPTDQAVPDDEGTMSNIQPLFFIDVSKYDAVRSNVIIYDRPTDWKKARDEGGLRLAAIKISEGLNPNGTVNLDPAWKMQWTAAKGVLPRCAYHFFRANQNAIKQFDVMWEVLKTDFDQDSDFIALDVETYDGFGSGDYKKIALGADSFLYEAQKRLKDGKKPYLYTFPAFWKQIGGEKITVMKQRGLWLAQWPKDTWILNVPIPPKIFTPSRMEEFKNEVLAGAQVPMPLLPWGFPDWWQFTARCDPHVVPGHPGTKAVIDYNISYINLPVLTGTSDLPPVQDELANTDVFPKIYRHLYSGSWVFATQNDGYGCKITYRLVDKSVNVLEIQGAWARIEQGWIRLSRLSS